MIRPVSSATGMNSTGETSPRSGCSQRTRASNPAIRPVVERDDRLVVRPGTRSRSIARRRSVSSRSRSTTLVCIAWSKTTWRALPSALARYIAVSASRSSLDGLVVAVRRSAAMPMLAVAKTSWPPRQEREPSGPRGSARPAGARRRRRGCRRRGSRTRRRRAGRRVSPLADARLEPPADRDQELVAGHVAEAVVDDLEAVEVEEEHGEAVALRPLRSAGSRGRSRSMNRARLGRPVSASWKASWSSCSSAILRGVMSSWATTTRTALGVAEPGDADAEPAPARRRSGRGTRGRTRRGVRASPRRCPRRSSSPRSAPVGTSAPAGVEVVRPHVAGDARPAGRPRPQPAPGGVDGEDRPRVVEDRDPGRQRVERRLEELVRAGRRLSFSLRSSFLAEPVGLGLRDSASPGPGRSRTRVAGRGRSPRRSSRGSRGSAPCSTSIVSLSPMKQTSSPRAGALDVARGTLRLARMVRIRPSRASPWNGL